MSPGLGVRRHTVRVSASVESAAVSWASQRPAEGGARVKLEHHGEIPPTFGRPDLGNLAGLHTVRRRHQARSVQGVRRYQQPAMGSRGCAPFPDRLGADTAGPQASRHAVLAHGVVRGAVEQLDLYARRMASVLNA